MIKYYAKNDLLPPPVKKKYSKDHIILLIFIYYFKSVLSISDIQTLLEPLKKRFQLPEGEFNLEKIYSTCFDLQKEELKPVIEDLKKKYERSLSTFEEDGLTEDEKKKMQMFSFIIQLLYDVYVKKLLIEKILDNIVLDEAKTGKKQKSKEDRKNKTKE
jgi:DNA-binding transcriptional MerR regulator